MISHRLRRNFIAAPDIAAALRLEMTDRRIGIADPCVMRAWMVMDAKAPDQRAADDKRDVIIALVGEGQSVQPPPAAICSDRDISLYDELADGVQPLTEGSELVEANQMCSVHCAAQNRQRAAGRLAGQT